MRKGIKKIARIIVAVALITSCMTANVFASNILTDLTAGAGKKEVSVSVYANTRVVKNTVAHDSSSDVASSSVIGKKGAEDISTGSETLSSMSSAKADVADSESEDAVNTADEEDEYAKYFITTSAETLNVRESADEDAKVAGYLYKDCVGEILEQDGEWIRVKSGKLTGWVKGSGLLYGKSARNRVKSAILQVAEINTDGLRIREEASLDADINAMLGMNDVVEVIGTDEDGWTEIEYEDGTAGSATGFISNEYITLKLTYKQGETVEEVKEREEKAEASKKAAEEEKQKEKEEAEKKEESEKQEETAAQAAVSEDATKATVSEDETKTAVSEEKVGVSSEAPAEVEETAVEAVESTTINTGAVSASTNDELLLAALIQCECNGPYEAQLAVGAVVVNRAKYGYGSIANAIYAPHQFGPASSGKLAATLATGAISATAMQAAHDAISGVSNVGTARYFRNVRSGHAGIVIGNHVYW